MAAGDLVGIVLLPELFAVEGLVGGRGAAKDAAVGHHLGFGEVWRVVAGEVAGQFLLDFHALPLRAVVFVGPCRIRRALEGLIVGFFDVGERASIGALLHLVGEVVGFELGGIEEKAAALGARR